MHTHPLDINKMFVYEKLCELSAERDWIKTKNISDKLSQTLYLLCLETLINNDQITFDLWWHMAILTSKTTRKKYVEPSQVSFRFSSNQAESQSTEQDDHSWARERREEFEHWQVHWKDSYHILTLEGDIYWTKQSVCIRLNRQNFATISRRSTTFEQMF